MDCSLKDQWAVFSYTALCPFSQSPVLETISILRGAHPVRGEKAVGHLAGLTYRPLFVALTKGPSLRADINTSIQGALNDACCGPDPGLGVGGPDVSYSASALRELSEKNSFVYKDSQINSGKGHGTGAASLPGVRGRARTPPTHLNRCESKEQNVIHVTLGICLMVVSCPICGNHPLSSYLNPAL